MGFERGQLFESDKEGVPYHEKAAPRPRIRGQSIIAEYNTSRPVLTQMRMETDSEPTEQTDLPAAVNSQNHSATSPGHRKRVQVNARHDAATIESLENGLSTYPGPDTLARTKRLILAAIKVWELKNGIRHD